MNLIKTHKDMNRKKEYIAPKADTIALFAEGAPLCASKLPIVTEPGKEGDQDDLTRGHQGFWNSGFATTEDIWDE